MLKVFNKIAEMFRKFSAFYEEYFIDQFRKYLYIFYESIFSKCLLILINKIIGLWYILSKSQTAI